SPYDPYGGRGQYSSTTYGSRAAVSSIMRPALPMPNALPGAEPGVGPVAAVDVAQVQEVGWGKVVVHIDNLAVTLFVTAMTDRDAVNIGLSDLELSLEQWPEVDVVEGAKRRNRLLQAWVHYYSALLQAAGYDYGTAIAAATAAAAERGLVGEGGTPVPSDVLE